MIILGEYSKFVGTFALKSQYIAIQHNTVLTCITSVDGLPFPKMYICRPTKSSDLPVNPPLKSNTHNNIASNNNKVL